MFLFQGQHRRDIERKAQPIVSAFNEWTKEKELELSTTKTSLMTIHPNYRQLKREPTLKIDGKNIRAVKQIEYLGLTFCRNRSWLPHLRKVGQRTRITAMNLNKVAARSWGIDTNLIRTWYLTVTQRQFAYAAHIWMRKATKEMIKLLDTLQRPFLIKMTKSYKTAPQSALQVLSGVMPLDIFLEAEITRIMVLNLKRQVTNPIIDIDPQQVMTKNTNNHLAPYARDFSDSILLRTTPMQSPQQIYTDGSKHDGEVGAAYVVYREGTEVATWQGKLEDQNSVYQAELLAISQALEYALQTTLQTTIFTDSRSSLEALLSQDQRHPQVQNIQLTLANMDNQAKHRIKLTWIKAHAGHEGNERADRLAKEATKSTQKYQLALPISHVKRKLKELCMKKWTEHWRQSETGRQVFDIFSTPRLNPTLPTAALTSILTGHGPFNYHIHRFKKGQTDMCICGQVGTSVHYLLHCQLTKKWHCRPPPPGKEEAWGLHMLKSTGLQRKTADLLQWLSEHQTELTPS